MAHKLYSGFHIQNAFMSTTSFSSMKYQLNEVPAAVPMKYRTSSNRHQEIRAVYLMRPYFSCTTADFEIHYFFNKVDVGVLVNTRLIFYDLQQTWLSQLKTNVKVG